MMSDGGGYRPQTPQQQQQMQQQYSQMQPQQIQPPSQQFPHQQMMVNGLAQQQPMSTQYQHSTGSISVQQQPPIHAVTAPTMPSQPSGAPPIVQSVPTHPTPALQPPQPDGNHPVIRAKNLVAELKQSLQALMRSASDGVKEVATEENSSTSTETQSPRVPSGEEWRQSLEAFDSVCDQIEANFLLLQELHRQQAAGGRFTPATVLASGQKGEDGQQMVLSFKEYEELTRLQTQVAASFRDSFLECGRLLE